MKVNGKPIFEIVTHESVLVEKTIKHLILPKEVPVYASFDYRDVIGIASLRASLGKTYATIRLFANVKGYPAVAYIDKGTTKKVYALAVCSTPNADPDIKSL